VICFCSAAICELLPELALLAALTAPPEPIAATILPPQCFNTKVNGRHGARM
jgi:hypothetical protein